MDRKTKQRPLVAIVINEPDQNFYSKTMYYMQKELFAFDADAAVFNTLLTLADQQDIEDSVFSLIEPELIDGLIVFGRSLKSGNILDEVRRIVECSNIPMVYVDSVDGGEDSVGFNNDECTDIIVRHLTEWHDISDVCYVSGPRDSDFHNSLLESFRAAFAEQGVELTDDRVFYGYDWVCDYGAIADSIIKRGLPKAVVCCSDFTAAGLLGAFHERGVRVPDDVIITGYSRNEPFESEYINITSIERRPEMMAVEAVRRLMADMGVAEYVPPEKKPSCVLRKGVTCGCERPDYAALARSAMDNMVSTRREGFDSYYNSMSETLVSADTFGEYLWKLDWYTRFLGEPDSFWLCINDGVMHVPGDKLEDYSEVISIAYSRQNGKGAVPGGASFNRHEMLPAIFKEREKPMSFIFNCLHFGRVNYGYTVLSYGDTGAFFDKHFVMWMRYAAIAIDKQRRHILYNDSVSGDQIRDPLTGLLNVRGYKKVMTQLCGGFERPDKLMRIISVDIENLRGINSAYGYNEGDKVLQRLAMVLNNSAGDDDICVRVSGDEFFICGLLDADLPVDDVPGTLEANLDAFNTGTFVDYGVHFFTSRVTAPVTSADILDQLPYEANYQRKMVKDNRNKNRRKMFAAEVKSAEDYDPEERMTVAKMLNDNLLTYHFQPIVSARTGEIVAYEALMRSPGDIRISPISILDHAAAMGRLDDVEWHTMRNLFKFRYDHRAEMGDKLLFINSIPSCVLPDKDFEDLCDTYSDILDKIVIEITEQTEASEVQLKKVLERRSRRGFGIAIDDYGTGYSNISSLLTFMPNCVKIDRSLIMNIHEDKRKQHFSRNIIDYAHDNRFKVLAEGVEKIEELHMLISMGIDLIQGYLTARPAPEPVEFIRPDIRDKIREYSNINRKATVKKTYFAENCEISLNALDFDEYTEVFVTSDNCTLKGREGYSSNMKVRVKDGLDCRLKLVNADLIDERNEPCIMLGKGSRLTLEIIGKVKLGGPISVPEGSMLEIEGGGELIMESSTNQSYGIGSDPVNAYGSIAIRRGVSVSIDLDGEYCIGIGGGRSGKHSFIEISDSHLTINLRGKHLVCVGNSEDDARISVRGSRLALSYHCMLGIGIGSSRGRLEAEIVDSVIGYEASGDNISGICAVTMAKNTAKLRKSAFNMIMRGKSIVGIGSAQGILSVDAEECQFNIDCEGARAIGVGGLSAESSLRIADCTGRISVSTSSGMAVMAAPDMLTAEGTQPEQIKNG